MDLPGAWGQQKRDITELFTELLENWNLSYANQVWPNLLTIQSGNILEKVSEDLKAINAFLPILNEENIYNVEGTIAYADQLAQHLIELTTSLSIENMPTETATGTLATLSAAKTAARDLKSQLGKISLAMKRNNPEAISQIILTAWNVHSTAIKDLAKMSAHIRAQQNTAAGSDADPFAGSAEASPIDVFAGSDAVETAISQLEEFVTLGTQQTDQLHYTLQAAQQLQELLASQLNTQVQEGADDSWVDVKAPPGWNMKDTSQDPLFRPSTVNQFVEAVQAAQEALKNFIKELRP